MNKYNAVILGCGRIAGGYDHPGSKVVLTHAHAIQRSEKINLAGVYDINLTSAKEMAGKWGTNAYDSIHELFDKTHPDLVIIAVPDEFHEQMLETILPFSPKFVVCEKPLGTNLEKLRFLIQSYGLKGTKIAVNFNRSYDPRIAQVKKDIAQGIFGKFLNGVLFYSKGLRHNGSHAISLLRYVFGEIDRFTILDSIIDYREDDPSVDLKIVFQDGKKFYLLAGDETKYSIFEWQFLFSKVRLTFKEDGFKVCRQEVTEDRLFPGYKTLGDEKCEESGLKDSMSMLYENAINNLETGDPLLSPAEDALVTQSVIEMILKDFHNK